ncbi:hypothetical protein [Escherichia coli]
MVKPVGIDSDGKATREHNDCGGTLDPLRCTKPRQVSPQELERSRLSDSANHPGDCQQKDGCGRV